MTKQGELEILEAAVANLGNDSYCGPWLRSVLSEVRHDMQSDFYPVASIAATRRDAASIISRAQCEADKILEAAERKAKDIVDRATNKDRSIREELAAAIRKASNSIN